MFFRDVLHYIKPELRRFNKQQFLDNLDGADRPFYEKVKSSFIILLYICVWAQENRPQCSIFQNWVICIFWICNNIWVLCFLFRPIIFIRSRDIYILSFKVCEKSRRRKRRKTGLKPLDHSPPQGTDSMHGNGANGGRGGVVGDEMS